MRRSHISSTHGSQVASGCHIKQAGTEHAHHCRSFCTAASHGTCIFTKGQTL